MQIRYAEEKDRLALGHIYCEAWKKAYRGMMPDAFLDGLTDEKAAPKAVAPGSVLVTEENGVITGLTNFGPPRQAEDKNPGELRSIYVLPEYWGSGAGAMLLQGAQDVLRDAGYAGVYLWVLRDNSRARRFYNKMGMMDTGIQQQIMLAGTELTEVRYELWFRKD